MKNLLLKVVNGNPEEWPKIAMLLSIGFFSGIFLATYEVIPTVSFLQYFDEKTFLPYAFVISGGLSVFSAYIFNLIQKRGNYKKLVFYTMLLATVFVISLTVAIKIQSNKWIIFVIYIMHTPVSSLVILVFWGVFGRLFDIKSAKRLAGGIDTGQAISAIIGFFTIPLIKGLVGEQANFMIGSSFCILINLILFTILLQKCSFQTDISSSISEKRQNRVNSKKLIQGNYVTLMGIFIILSLSSAYLVDYSFLSVTGEFFDADQVSDNNRLINYISFFEGIVIIFSFLVQTFLNDKIVEIYGIRTSLMLVPGVLAIFTLAAVGIGHIFGYTSESDAFLFFFLMISASKLFVDALRDSLENPVFKTLFFPIPVSERFNVQVKIEGIVREAAALIIGGLLIFTTSIETFDLIYNSYIILAVIILWIYTTIKMYREYKNTLKTVLESNYSEDMEKVQTEHVVEEIIRELKKNDISLQMRILSLLSKVDFFAWCRYIYNLDNSISDELKEYILRQIHEKKIITLEKKIDSFLEGRNPNEDIFLLAEQIKGDLFTDKEKASDYQRLLHLCTSRSSEKRLCGVYLLSFNIKERTLELLLPLLRDLVPQVRREALVTAGKLRIETIIPILIEHLGIKEYENTAFTSLVKFGEKVLQKLEVAFHRNGQDPNIQRTIVRIYSNFTNKRKSFDALERKLNSSNRRLFFEIVKALNYFPWKVSKSSKVFLKISLREQIQNGIWILAASTEIEHSDDTQLLSDALKQEVAESYSKVFLLLYLLYDKEYVKLVEENMEIGTKDNVTYALELLNLFIDEELQSIVIPFLDDTSPSDKVKKYEILFPRAGFNNKEVLFRIINRDYAFINRWTKACAIYAYVMRADAAISNALTANLFNTDHLLCETAAWAIHKIDPFSI